MYLAAAGTIQTDQEIEATQIVGSSSPLAVEEVLPLYASSIPACWRLYFDGGIAEVERVLPDYIAQLTAIAQQSTTYQRMAAVLASQSHQLSWLLALQHQDFGGALTAIKQAYRYGDIADDNQLRVSSLVRQAHVYFHLIHPHLSGSATGYWPFQVTSELDAERQKSILAAIVELELHQRIFETNWRILPITRQWE